MLHKLSHFLAPLLPPKAAPAGYASLSINELYQTLNSLLDQIKYEMNNQILADKLAKYINSCQSILELLDKKLCALIGTKQTHTTARQEIFERIKSKIAALLKINEPEKITETRAAQIKKMISEIMNACQVLSQHMQQDIEKINFFPPMEKSALIALIRDIDAKTYYFDIPELPIALLKKYLQSKEFAKIALDTEIRTQLFLDFVNEEEKTQLYHYYSDNAALPVENQAEIFKYLMRGMNEANYERMQVTEKNRDKLTSYLPVEIWDHTLQFLNESDLRRVKCSATFFRDLMREHQTKPQISKNYSLPIEDEMSISPIIEVDSNCRLIVNAINENLLAIAHDSQIDILKLQTQGDNPINISSITIPKRKNTPARIMQLAVAKNRKTLAIWLSFKKSYYINIYDLPANNQLKLRTMIPINSAIVGQLSLSHDGQILIYTREIPASLFQENNNNELVFYDLEKNCELKPKDKLKAHCRYSMDALITPNKTVISIHSRAYDDYHLRIWDEQAQCLHNINLHSITNELCAIEHIGLLPNNKVWLLNDNTIYVFDLTNGKMVEQIKYKNINHEHKFEKSLLLPDGKIAFVTHNGEHFTSKKPEISNYMYMSLAIFDPATQEFISNTHLPLTEVDSMVVAENGNIIVAGKQGLINWRTPFIAVTYKFADLQCEAKLDIEKKDDKVTAALPTPKG